MHLYDNPASPFCRKVDILLHELGDPERIERVAAVGGPTNPGSMPTSINPLGKIPTLVLDDAPAIFDSRVICRFLNDRYQARFYPEARIWEVLTLEALADGIMDAAVLMVYEGRARAEDKQDSTWVEAQWTKVARGLDMLEDRWVSHLSGHLDIGGIATGAALGYLDFRHPERNWRESHPGLAAWFAGISERPSFQQTTPANP